MLPTLMMQNVGLNYHSKTSETNAIDNISFCVNKGEFVGLVGPSGCGKTTLLSIISGILVPSRGQVLIEGKSTKDKNAVIGYMFQRDLLFPWRTIWQNVNLGAELKHNKNTAQKATALLKKYGIYDFKDKYPHELSGGMRQRVALIRTLVLNPQILLLDEPFGALDYQTRQNVIDDISGIIKNENTTSLLVTHDITEAICMCDKVIVLSKRPSQVKKVIDIQLDKTKPPSQRKTLKKFFEYQTQIWKELA